VKKIVWFLVLAMIVTIVSSVGLAAKPERDPAVIANELLDRLTTAYVTKNVPLLASLYDDPTVAGDITRNLYEFYTAERLTTELEEVFSSLTGITTVFTDRQITSEDDTIMVRTFRTVGANEIPFVAKVELLLVLKQPSSHKQPWNYVITDQILLSEEYIPVTTPPQVGDPGNATEQFKEKHKKHRHVM
jgi:hypothetical protein